MNKIKVHTDFERLQLKARDAIDFLNGHPALISAVIDVRSALWFSIQTVCKRGYCESARDNLQIYKNSKHALRFKDQFEKELKNYSAEDLKRSNSFISIDVTYKELFGEDWKFDHVAYWGELSFYMFTGRPTRKNNIDLKNWQSYAGVEASGRTYEEMVINIAQKFKKAFGNFRSDDFLTQKEKENNRIKEPFHFKTYKKIYSRIIHNRDYIHVNDAKLNLRWQTWYRKTAHYKKNWAR
jgi:hypothetical protein